MTELSRLQVGRDVPWVTSWSLEVQTGVLSCRSVDGQLAVGQQERPGVGRPLYARNHLVRQRRSVRELLCPMCGRPTSQGDRWSQTASWTTAGVLRGRGFGWALPADLDDDARLLNCGAIAPLHRACAETALVHCPHLRSASDRELKRFPPSWLVVPLMVEAVSGGRRPRRVAVVSFLQLLGVESGP